MIQRLQLTNVGPGDIAVEFAPRLNLITGDNGLGKSFLLDIVWWCLTRTWPAECNPRMIAGKMAMPSDYARPSSIRFGNGSTEDGSSFDRERLAWLPSDTREACEDLVFYAMMDGSFALWEPNRYRWRKKNLQPDSERMSAFVFSPHDVWNGLRANADNWLCNGLIRDWTLWQSLNNAPWNHLRSVLERLSPDADAPLHPGNPTRISIEDSRDIPTLRMPYSQEVPIVFTSSAIQRTAAIAYLLAWLWDEHQKSSKLLGVPSARNIVFLFDEVELHLHPRWQRVLLPALLHVTDSMASDVSIQLLAVTHSPLVMASAECVYQKDTDRWFDLDLTEHEVTATHREYEKHGDCSSWLQSRAFDLQSGYGLEAERAIAEADMLMSREVITQNDAIDMTHKLTRVLPEFDPHLRRWLWICEKKGWLP